MMRKLFVNFCVTLLFVFCVAALEAKQCELQVATANSVLHAGKKQTVCLKVGIKGFELKSEKERAPINVALVIDRSGSMQGKKIEQAKEAAIQALQRLEPKDIASVIVFDSNVEVLVPATKISDREILEQKIRSIHAGSSTALYGGTQKGIEEVRKFLEKGYVNRVILLSDGLANVGPSSPEDLAKLGKSCGGEGISVTTFGLGNGYNEDLMVKLAATSDGNHKFIESADEMADIFQKEFNTALSVVAQEVSCVVTIPEGIRPVRALNGDVDIKGQEVKFGWNQIYSRHERFVILEVEVPAEESGQTRELAKVSLRYTNMETKDVDQLSGRLEVKFSNSETQVKNSLNKSVMEDYVELLANLENKRAMQLRDAGDIKGAQTVFTKNVDFLEQNSKVLDSVRLKRSASMNANQSREVNSPAWPASRKKMIEYQNSYSNQQKY
ncbi:MAG: VWA domain-containing protein [Planctomycetaceae bacterium]|jgi:Ca-activated chloride channel family protein|nr:VWA domain-containing protein [Planctomycetaceae bacterium]